MGARRVDLPVQGAEPRALLLLVILHPDQNRIEHAHRFEDMWPLVEHDALGTAGHRGVGQFRSSRDALFSEAFQPSVDHSQ